ncbi:hypothetical protein NP233_g87 [Leucocoprinus birnbaumii]|uniref:Uncharacterized protein n=1 Tax=Leucocoprinus birnbaumii TaxID=56174 RepID=A0AAD5Z0H0_9AGAR|nr:hypothetical protein NP233_g87 [Leucocoprinus birnbaumii]
MRGRRTITRACLSAPEPELVIRWTRFSPSQASLRRQFFHLLSRSTCGLQPSSSLPMSQTVHPPVAVDERLFEELLKAAFEGNLSDTESEAGFQEEEPVSNEWGSESEFEEEESTYKSEPVLDGGKHIPRGAPSAEQRRASCQWRILRSFAAACGDFFLKQEGNHPQMQEIRMRTESPPANLATHGHTVRPKLRAKIISPQNVIPTNLDASRLPVLPGSYHAKPRVISPLDSELPELTLEALDAEPGWIGQTPPPILDCPNRVVGVLAGRPNNDTFLPACDRLYEAMSREASQVVFNEKDTDHPRDRFPATIRYHPGQGSKRPVMRSLHRYKEMIDRLVANEEFQNLADWHICELRFFKTAISAPELECIRALVGHRVYDRKLKLLTPASAYPAAAFNFGPDAHTGRHRDPKNRAYSWCVIQSLGKYNPATGSHLVLDDLCLVIEFPPGSVILIPLATFLHANVSICPGEAQAPISQFCPRSLLRFVDSGFIRQKSIKKKSRKFQREMEEIRHAQLQKGMSMYKPISELVGDCTAGAVSS